MRNALSSSAWALALVMACADQGPQNTSAGVEGESWDRPDDNSKLQCLTSTPSGQIQQTLFLGTSSFAASADVAVDIDDNVLYASHGLTKLTDSGTVLFHVPFGDLVATDAAGNIYLAGMFNVATDFGLGMLQPHGDGHAFLVKLTSSGRPMFARELQPCGTQSVTSLAVGANGRIAISGVGMGTRILDDRGELLFTSDLVGDVAFDSQGNLLVTGAIDTDMFIAKLDANARLVFDLRIGDRSNATSGTQVGTHITVDASDNIIVTGTATKEGVNLFGQDWVSGTTPTGDTLALGFILKLTSSGSLVWTHVYDVERDGGVAVDPFGNVIYSAMDLAYTPPYLLAVTTKLAADDGRHLWARFAPATSYGTALGVASDSCGSAFWATNVLLSLSDPNAAPAAYLVKLSL